jgi:hypothetical protein
MNEKEVTISTPYGERPLRYDDSLASAYESVSREDLREIHGSLLGVWTKEIERSIDRPRQKEWESKRIKQGAAIREAVRIVKSHGGWIAFDAAQARSDPRVDTLALELAEIGGQCVQDRRVRPLLMLAIDKSLENGRMDIFRLLANSSQPPVNRVELTRLMDQDYDTSRLDSWTGWVMRNWIGGSVPLPLFGFSNRALADFLDLLGLGSGESGGTEENLTKTRYRWMKLKSAKPPIVTSVRGGREGPIKLE